MATHERVIEKRVGILLGTRTQRRAAARDPQETAGKRSAASGRATGSAENNDSSEVRPSSRSTRWWRNFDSAR